MIRLYTNRVNIKLEMHSIRLQCQQFKLHRCAANLVQKFVQTSIKSGCVNYSTAEVSAATNNIENQQFKAAVLQPKKQNLTLETLVLPERAADGMVRNGNKQTQPSSHLEIVNINCFCSFSPNFIICCAGSCRHRLLRCKQF